MFYTETISCRVAIQVCVGYFPNGRKRRFTFSMKGIRPDASEVAIAAVVRALAPVLVYPIIKVRKVVKRTIVFDDWTTPAVPAEIKRDTGVETKRDTEDGIPYTENPARLEPVITNWPEFFALAETNGLEETTSALYASPTPKGGGEKEESCPLT